MYCSSYGALKLQPTFISDGVLNPSGVRFGSGEIYSAMETFADIIDDSLCIGQRRSGDADERVLLFVKMRPGYKFSAELSEKIKKKIKEALSSRHVPSFIFEVEDIPVRLHLTSALGCTHISSCVLDLVHC